MRIPPLAAWLALAVPFCALPACASAQGIALMPLRFLDTSHEPADQAARHDARLALMTEEIARGLGGAGQVRVVTARDMDLACPQASPPCLNRLAADGGSRRAVYVVVHKSSTLILQVFVQVMDVGAERLIARRELSFRGDSDESWRKAGHFLAESIAPELE